jgi:predicted transcriptional regulator
MSSVIGQFDAVDIDDQVVAQMVKKGWSEEEVLKLKAEGYRYSPGRDSLLGPIMSSDDVEDLDEHLADHQGPA